jgi:dephospho-CoA kinase
MQIIAITGMPGAGKSTAASALEGLNLKKVVMGDVIREETRRRGLIPDSKNTGIVMQEIREKFGEGAIGELSLKSILQLKGDVVIVDGIRSIAEVDVFRKSADVILIAIHASRKRRFQLLKERRRNDDPINWEAFVSRDDRELNIGIGKAIALADEVISNEHITPDELGQKVVSIAKYWMKSLGK